MFPERKILRTSIILHFFHNPHSSQRNLIVPMIHKNFNLIPSFIFMNPLNKNIDTHFLVSVSDPQNVLQPLKTSWHYHWVWTAQQLNMDREDIKMLVKKWWDIYEDETLDYNNNSVNVERFTSALLDAGGFQFVPAPSAA